MYDYYRIAVLTGAACVCAGTFFRKTRQHRPWKRFIRPLIDFLILLVLFLSPFFEFWFSRSPEKYVSFVIRFIELVFCSLLVSLPVDQILRQKDYRNNNASGAIKRMDFIRDSAACLIVSFGLILFEGCTALAYLAGASVPLQIILPSAALLLYRGLFLLFSRIRREPDETPGIHLREAGSRILQAGTATFFWIRIVMHIENNDFPAISGIPESTAAALTIITLVTCALALITGLQILCSK